MAGSYPDVPGHRMAYDRDGSTVVCTDGSSDVVELSSSAAQALNDEVASQTGPTSNNKWTAVIFPELRDLRGYLFQRGTANDSPEDIEVSDDTTNGLDGTWVSGGTSSRDPGSLGDTPSKEQMRTDIESVSISDIIAVRATMHVGGDTQPRLFHLYGSPSTGEATDRLRIWHPTSDAEVGGAYLDWGDIAQVSTHTRDIRIKNPSSQTANDVTFTTEILTDASPSVTVSYEFSVGGGAYESSLNIGDIAAGAISDVVTVRRTVPSDAALSLWWPRAVVSASSWT